MLCEILEPALAAQVGQGFDDLYNTALTKRQCFNNVVKKVFNSTQEAHRILMILKNLTKKTVISMI